MVQVQVTKTDDGRLFLLARFEDGDMVGSGSAEIGPEESYLGVGFEQWSEHSGLVEVSGDPPALTVLVKAL